MDQCIRPVLDSNHLVTLHPDDPQEWELCQAVVSFTKEYLGRSCLALGRPVREGDPEGRAGDEQYAERLRAALDQGLAKQLRLLKARYTKSALPVTFKQALAGWEACREVFQNLYDQNNLLYLCALEEFLNDLKLHQPRKDNELKFVAILVGLSLPTVSYLQFPCTLTKFVLAAVKDTNHRLSEDGMRNLPACTDPIPDPNS